jgi:hypothetical protein
VRRSAAGPCWALDARRFLTLAQSTRAGVNYHRDPIATDPTKPTSIGYSNEILQPQPPHQAGRCHPGRIDLVHNRTGPCYAQIASIAVPAACPLQRARRVTSGHPRSGRFSSDQRERLVVNPRTAFREDS